MDKRIEATVNEYLKSVTDEVSGECWASHSGAGYVYWSIDCQREGSSTYPVDAIDLRDKGLLSIEPDKIVLDGPHGDVVLPIKFDFAKIRRRIEDALRKTATDQQLLKLADVLSVKLI